MYRNTKNVPYYVFGRGSLAQLGDLLNPAAKPWTVRSSISSTTSSVIMN